MPDLFLSPSTQEYNVYYDGVQNEEYYMNLIADEMEDYLRASGISFTRNDPAGRVSDSITLSNSSDHKFHLALHSNAAGEANTGNVRGVDIYYYQGSAEGKRDADIIVKNIKAVYPNPDLVRALPTTSLAELRRTRAPAVLAELGYHDNREDAEWIRANISAIAKAMAQSVAEILGVPFVSPGGNMEPQSRGMVVTGGGRLNIRDMPDLSGTVIGQAPNGSTLTLYGKEGDWYQVSRGGVKGYSFAQYIKPI